MQSVQYIREKTLNNNDDLCVIMSLTRIMYIIWSMKWIPHSRQTSKELTWCDGTVIKEKHFPCYWHLAGYSPLTRKFPSQRPVKRSFHVFFDLRLNKRLNKHSRRRWFETPSRPLWRHCSIRHKAREHNCNNGFNATDMATLFTKGQIINTAVRYLGAII